jgi:hypothetical protein
VDLTRVWIREAEVFFHPKLMQDLAADRTAELRREAAKARRATAANTVAGSLPRLSALPLFRPGGAGDAGYMNLINHLPSGLRRVARKIASVVAECNWAQRRLGELRMDPEGYVLSPDNTAPDTYADFLLRTSGTLRHEPTARERSEGRRQLR